ncbi:Concanavalin A-like lectin/glucanase domain-containing protein [Dioscorea alata]|uniref:Concanavalin A-like lectin/glucanase domain-containing protein n=1 Tax=Dioscorea alata TaxID=55571 RepID=A0ACB7USN3_DIOAL|nr:Concanavalin A-like lectin/glucanase domain-containing protein [Dioscorea alata]
MSFFPSQAYPYPYFSPPPPSFIPPPPPPHRTSPPPPPHSPPPPSPPRLSPPPPHSPPPFPPRRSPPPPHSPPPPPPHITPPLPPVPPPPAPHHYTVIIVVFVSLSGLFLLAFLAACCFIKQKKKKSTQKTEIINVEDHVHVHETIVPGPHGQKIVILDVDEDIKVQEDIKKSELVGEASCAANAGLVVVNEQKPHPQSESKSHHLLQHKG